MALHQIEFTFNSKENSKELSLEWSHTGVVGSGDMEVLLRRVELNGKVQVKITTPVRGFDEVWEKVLRNIVDESNLRNVVIEINDNNSTPFIVTMRLKQALMEAFEGGLV